MQDASKLAPSAAPKIERFASTKRTLTAGTSPSGPPKMLPQDGPSGPPKMPQDAERCKVRPKPAEDATRTPLVCPKIPRTAQNRALSRAGTPPESPRPPPEAPQTGQNDSKTRSRPLHDRPEARNRARTGGKQSLIFYPGHPPMQPRGSKMYRDASKRPPEPLGDASRTLPGAKNH